MMIRILLLPFSHLSPLLYVAIPLPLHFPHFFHPQFPLLYSLLLPSLSPPAFPLNSFFLFPFLPPIFLFPFSPDAPSAPQLVSLTLLSVSFPHPRNPCASIPSTSSLPYSFFTLLRLTFNPSVLRSPPPPPPLFAFITSFSCTLLVHFGSSALGCLVGVGSSVPPANPDLGRLLSLAETYFTGRCVSPRGYLLQLVHRPPTVSPF